MPPFPPPPPRPPPSPVSAPFPLPFSSAFAAQGINEPGRLLSDLWGAFEVSADPQPGAPRARVLRQSAPQPPNAWLGTEGTPFTSLPTPGTAFANARFSVDALVRAADVAGAPDARVATAAAQESGCGVARKRSGEGRSRALIMLAVMAALGARRGRRRASRA